MLSAHEAIAPIYRPQPPHRLLGRKLYAQTITPPCVWEGVEAKVRFLQRVTWEIALRHQTLRKAAAIDRIVDMRRTPAIAQASNCLLYTSDAADE